MDPKHLLEFTGIKTPKHGLAVVLLCQICVGFLRLEKRKKRHAMWGNVSAMPSKYLDKLITRQQPMTGLQTPMHSSIYKPGNCKLFCFWTMGINFA